MRILLALGLLVAVWYLFFRKGAAYANLVPPELRPNFGGPTGTGRSAAKMTSDLAVTGACLYATSGTTLGAASPLCGAAAPFATNVAFSIGGAGVSIAKTLVKNPASLVTGDSLIQRSVKAAKECGPLSSTAAKKACLARYGLT